MRLGNEKAALLQGDTFGDFVVQTPAGQEISIAGTELQRSTSSVRCISHEIILTCRESFSMVGSLQRPVGLHLQLLPVLSCIDAVPADLCLFCRLICMHATILIPTVRLQYFAWY